MDTLWIILLIVAIILMVTGIAIVIYWKKKFGNIHDEHGRAWLAVGCFCIIASISLIIYVAVSDGSGGACQGSVTANDLRLANGAGAITAWAWNTLVVGGYQGYGIFANSTGGYTWDKTSDKAVGPSTTLLTKWDDQDQYTLANGNTYTQVKQTLNNKDSGSQFWDFVSKKGSYFSKKGARSLDGIKIQYDATSDMSFSSRGQQLVQNLVKEGLHVGILIGGRPLTDGTKYHGIAFSDMLTQIENASQWIIDNKLGDQVYVALDIEPADKVLNEIGQGGEPQNVMDPTYQWYATIFPQVAKTINKFKCKNVYYGMAINKNPYGGIAAYNGLKALFNTNWTVDGKPRGFRVLELMYWWTYIDTQLKQLSDSHLGAQLQTTAVGHTPISDALKYGLYLQFGMETTGEVTYLGYVPTTPKTTCDTCNQTNYIANCYRPLDGVIQIDDNIGYRCKSIGTSGSDFVVPTGITDDKAAYWNTIKKKGSLKDYVPFYGYPYIPWGKGTTKYNLKQCNALGNVTTTKGDNPVGTPGHPTCTSAAWSTKSCAFLNTESWLLGGGLKNKSMEEFLHSADAINWLKKLINSLITTNAKAEDIIFHVPFCVEDITGYSGWLYNYYNKTDGFPDTILPADDDKHPLPAAGSICKTQIVMNKDGSINTHGPPGNISCLGQTMLNSEYQPTWIAGTLNTGGTCDTANHYFSSTNNS